MFVFQILKKSKKSRARLGLIRTDNGVIETPAFVPVATQAVVKTLNSEEAALAGSQLLIANTFHLHLKPGEKIINRAGGLHEMMNWKRPLMTDSGGYQVFSLGFGSDYEVSKIFKTVNEEWRDTIKNGSQPKNIKITDDGVYFQSPIDGKRLFLGPKESMLIQKKLGADMIFAFDECTSPYADYEYVKASMTRTHRWAKICTREHGGGQALFGIVQGSRFRDLREESARFINSLDFAGYGIGGDLGDDTRNVLKWTIPLLNEQKPRHLLGIGYLDNTEYVISRGVDLFDCIVPTHYGRRGIAFTSSGKLNMKQGKFLTDKSPLDKKCDCFVCRDYRRNYIAHLVRAHELTALKFLTFHNLHFFNGYVERLRDKIRADLL